MKKESNLIRGGINSEQRFEDILGFDSSAGWFLGNGGSQLVWTKQLAIRPGMVDLYLGHNQRLRRANADIPGNNRDLDNL